MEPIVDIQDVTVSYRDNVALNSISLKIYKGEMLAIAGPNGAGKTTLLTAINGLGKLLQGSVNVFGIEDLHLNLLPVNCSRMVLFKETRIIFEGPMSEALNEEVLSNLYDCRVTDIKNNYGISIRAG